MAAKTEKERRLAEGRYKHAQIKDALVKMFCGKCAYCESRITHIDYGHIEHFNPKSKRRDLAFRWSNLLLACGICNGPEHKADRFPGPNEGGPLVNPCKDEPSDHFEFTFDVKTNLASVDGITRRGVTTEKVIGLNRPDLRSYRSTQMRRIAYIAVLAKTNAEAAALLEEAKRDSGENAAFVRALRI